AALRRKLCQSLAARLPDYLASLRDALREQDALTPAPPTSTTRMLLEWVTRVAPARRAAQLEMVVGAELSIVAGFARIQPIGRKAEFLQIQLQQSQRRRTPLAILSDHISPSTSSSCL